MRAPGVVREVRRGAERVPAVPRRRARARACLPRLTRSNHHATCGPASQLVTVTVKRIVSFYVI